MSIHYEQTTHIWRINFKGSIRNLVLIWENPLSSLILAFIIYSLLAIHNGPIWSSSLNAYYNNLADAFLHGQLNLRIIPHDTHDLVFFNHNYYLYWPPMPAVLLIPFVALFGIGFSDVTFTLFVAALNVSLVSLLLRQLTYQKLIKLSRLQRALLVLFFALGTVHVTLAPFGRVWFTGQLIGFFFIALAYLAALSIKGRLGFFLSGTSIACAMLTRNHLIFAGIWPAVYLLIRNKDYSLQKLLTDIAIGIMPIITGLTLMALYNWVRFGNILEVGLDYHMMAEIFIDNYQKYGAFNIHYLPTNFFYQYLAYPLPIRPESVMGGSLFLLSPVFFLAFRGIKTGSPRWSIWALVATILVVNVPILMLMGTGWVQFGPRYTLDFTIPLLILTSFGIKNWSNQRLALLTAISIVQYIFGTFLLSQIL